MRVNQKDKYLGMQRSNSQGYKMEVIDYIDYDHIKIRFLPPYECMLTTSMTKFMDGCIRNPYAPNVCGFGIVGNKYPTISSNRSHLLEYQTWINMIKRCYDEEHRFKNPSYGNVKCDERWKYYENFYEWMHEQENYNTLAERKDINIDKDILEKGNNLYSPDKCTLVPKRINNLLIKSDSIRGPYPIGVTYLKRNKKYMADCGGKDSHTYLGLYETPEEAFVVYKDFKEKQIQMIATEEFKRRAITLNCYEALMNYKVNITD